MSNDKRELPKDRLGSLDKKGYRVGLHPAPARGIFRDMRNKFYFFLILIFLGLPWISINGQQLILLNIPERKFSLFGLHFWAHDVPMVFFVLAILGIGLAFVTAVWGRVWCGWACPQTVFVDYIFRKIETFVEGNHIKQKKLDQAPWSFDKARKRSLKWFLYFIASFLIAHSFLAYFVGSDRVIEMMQSLPTANWTSFVVVFSMTFLVLFDFGWFREQFCIIMCPYGRFQSVLMDESSLSILYDEKRGEPRRGEVAKDQEGDCVNCYKCVNVCPTGIDIRRGVQMECITCTACIDACDEVMVKLKRPKGLIRYESLEGLAGGPKFKLTKARTFVYLTLIFVSIVGLVVSVSNRSDLDINFIRALEEPYKKAIVNDEVVITNHFRVHIKNQSFETADLSLKLPEEYVGKIELIAPTYPLNIESGKNAKNHIFIKFKKGTTQKGQLNLPINVFMKTKNKELIFIKELRLVGPLS